MIKKFGITPMLGIAISSLVIASMMSIATQTQHNVLAQSSSSSNPLAKVPVIGQLMGGNATKSSSSNQSSSNPLAKVPVIGKLMGGNATKSSTNATSNSSSAGNATKSSSSNQSSSNPLAKVPVIGKLFGGQ